MSTAATPSRIDRMAALHADHSRDVFRYIFNLTRGQRQISEDLTQETMVRAWRHVDSLPQDYEQKRRWLFTVARRLVIDTVRMRQARPVEIGLVDTGWLSNGRDDTGETALALRSVQAAIAELSDTQRRVLTAIYLHGESPQQISQRLGVPVGTVRSRAHYALKALRHALTLQTDGRMPVAAATKRAHRPRSP